MQAAAAAACGAAVLATHNGSAVSCCLLPTICGLPKGAAGTALGVYKEPGVQLLLTAVMAA